MLRNEEDKGEGMEGGEGVVKGKGTGSSWARCRPQSSEGEGRGGSQWNIHGFSSCALGPGLY